jgi:hypothetical protein
MYELLKLGWKKPNLKVIITELWDDAIQSDRNVHVLEGSAATTLFYSDDGESRFL